MKTIYFIFILILAWYIYIGQSAVPIDELVINSVYCEKDLPFFDCNIRVQRKNKTAQLVTGYFLAKQPSYENVSFMGQLLYQDYSGTWKGLILRYFESSCLTFDSIKNQKNRFVPDYNDGCPRKDGNFTVGPAYVNRYRKDWEPDLKFWIPPYFMEADNWKWTADFYYKDDPKTIIGKATMEFRLLNKFMSQ